MAVLGSIFIVTKGCSVCLAVRDINGTVVDHEDTEAQSIPCIGLAVEFQVLYTGLCPTEQLSWDHDFISEWLLRISSCCSKASHALLPREVVKIFLFYIVVLTRLRNTSCLNRQVHCEEN